MSSKRIKIKKFVISIVAIMLTITIAATILDNLCIKVAEYDIRLSDMTKDAKIVVISDLHGKEYGKDNKRLLAKISEQKPDAIFVVGDMFDDEVENSIPNATKLLDKLPDIAPVYYSYGNHELEHSEDIIASFENTITQKGVVVLDDSFVDCEIGGQKIRIGGTMGHAFPFGRTWEEFKSSEEYVFLKEMEKTDSPTIVLAHMPDTFVFNGAHNYWSNIDLVVSGHTHGGIVRVPFVGGLFAPTQGFFPEYDYGYYRLGEKMQMVITSGLSGHKLIPRVFNMPEICVLNLTGN